jgi:alpha-tubulin suppressor-like RCC1 family protein
VVLVSGALAAAPSPAQAGPPTTPLTEVRQVAAGTEHSCALLTSLEVRCWGAGGSGRLGNDDTGDSSAAVTVLTVDGSGALENGRSVVAGGAHTCVLLQSRQVRCWGENENGQLGDGGNDDASRPVVVLSPSGGAAPLRNVLQLTALRDATCAVLTNRWVYCWGDNEHGQLGDSTTTDRSRPVRVRARAGIAAGPLSKVTQIDGGDAHACVRQTDGRARCWGANDEGQLGDGTETERHHSVAVQQAPGPAKLMNVLQVSAGGSHSCARLRNREARCWGDGSRGAIGRGSTMSAHRAFIVSNGNGTGRLGGVIRIDAGTAHSCALLQSRQVRCWGSRRYGEIGDGQGDGSPGPDDALRPVTVLNRLGTGPLVGVRALHAGYGHTCVVLTNTQARCWGDNPTGAVGNGTTSPAENLPRPVLVAP